MLCIFHLLSLIYLLNKWCKQVRYFSSWSLAQIVWFDWIFNNETYLLSNVISIMPAKSANSPEFLFWFDFQIRIQCKRGDERFVDLMIILYLLFWWIKPTKCKIRFSWNLQKLQISHHPFDICFWIQNQIRRKIPV